MRAQVVSETPQPDGMVDLTIEMDEEFEAECRTAAAAVGKPVEIFLRDAIIAGVERRIAEEKHKSLASDAMADKSTTKAASESTRTDTAGTIPLDAQEDQA